MEMGRYPSAPVEDCSVCTVLHGFCFLYAVLSPYVPCICDSGVRIHLFIYPFNISEADWIVSKYIKSIGQSRLLDSQVTKQNGVSSL